jgi:CBS domain-containing protein
LEKPPSVVADIMSSPVVALDGGVNVRDAALLMTEKQIGSLIVNERGRPIGIVTKLDILKRVVSLCKDPCETRIKHIMSTPLFTIPSEASILEAMRKLRRYGVSRLVVMNGNMQGIVSEGDIIRACTIASLTSFSTFLRSRE